MKVILTGVQPKFSAFDGKDPFDFLGRELQKISFPVEVESFNVEVKTFVYLPMVEKPEEEWSIDWFTYEKDNVVNTSEQLDNYIQEKGKGNVRDALNVALFENSQMQEILEKIAYPRRGTEEEYWDVEQIGLICAATLKTLGKTF